MIRALLSLAMVTPLVLHAQTGDIRFEVGAARAFPPSGSDARASTYLTAGLQADIWSQGGSGVFAGVFGGLASDSSAGDWVSGIAGLRGVLPVAGPLELELDITGYGFRVGKPFTYTTLVGEVSPQAHLHFGRISVGLIGEGGTGQSALILRRGDLSRKFDADLWHYGGGPELSLRSTTGLVTLGGGVFESEAGTYRRVSVEVLARTVAGLTWQAGVRVWDTPSGTETTGGLTVSVPMGRRWFARMAGGRSDPDPLVMTQPGGEGGFTVGRRLVVFGESRRGNQLVTVSESELGQTVRFRLEAPDATEVHLLGDFSSWIPIPMERNGEAWVLELPVTEGVYHFGFMRDGEWYVPPGAPGIVSDEWGQMNATVVVDKPN